MGHGVRSALITAIMRGLIEELIPMATEPGRFLTELNRGLMQILQRTRTPLFASAFYLVADVTNGEMRYANAGHPSPVHLRRQAGVVEPLLSDETGPALGVFDDATYRTHHSGLMDRDAVLLFTDGLVEVQNAGGEEYGEERLLATVRERLTLSPDQLFEVVLGEVQQFAGKADFEDDVCLVGMEVVHANDAP
jgi:serine phosphatase RsbU (regulator of sigma subunit)